MATKQALVINRVAFENLGTWAIALRQYDDAITNMEACLDNLDQLDPRAVDLIVVLGDPISADEEGAYLFLIDELKFLECRLAGALPDFRPFRQCLGR